MYRYYANSTLMEEAELVTFTDFVDQLAHQLATNVLDAPAQAATRHKRPAERSADGQWVCCQPSPLSRVEVHALVSTREHPYFGGKRKGPGGDTGQRAPQARCQICHQDASFWCKGCSNDDQSMKPFIICGREGSKMKNCWETHMHRCFS